MIYLDHDLYLKMYSVVLTSLYMKKISKLGCSRAQGLHSVDSEACNETCLVSLS